MVVRPPNLAELNLEATRLVLDERGIPVFDWATADVLLEQPFCQPNTGGSVKPALRQICERARVKLSPMDQGSPSGRVRLPRSKFMSSL
jgi:hypothetical protein